MIDDLKALKIKPKWILIDEVQKVPELLDTVHLLIEDYKYKFILTGSSARKLKKGAANLLAGRAFSNYIFPITFFELKENFNLNNILSWGSLPKIFSLNNEEKKQYLESYCQTFLKEEILSELLVRNGNAFRQFLEVASQENGKSLNFSKLSRDIGVDPKTVESYFQILEDTLVGFFLNAYHQSIRKSVKLQPKFYLFDLGIKRALCGELDNSINVKTSAYGLAFEHFIICEVFRLNQYSKKSYSLSHYQTTAGGEIDLVLKKGRKIIAVEIKSTDAIDQVEVNKLNKISQDIKATDVFYVSNDAFKKKSGSVQCLHWKDFLKELFEN